MSDITSANNGLAASVSDIRCSGLYKWYGDRLVLNNVSLHVNEHEFVCVVGPSGCGKTTLLRMTAGLSAVDHGSIKMAGEPIAGPSPKAAVVFQGFGLFPWKTVYENIALPLRVGRVSAGEIRDRVAAIISLVGLDGSAKRYPGQLSGGMRQRVGLARALVVRPSVILLDEPFASVDAQTREMLQEELIMLWESYKQTSLFITHSIDEALTLADRVIVFSSSPGEIVDEIMVPIPRPRSPANVRRHECYASLRERIRSELRQNVASQLAPRGGTGYE